jgi:hypothetical protein
MPVDHKRIPVAQRRAEEVQVDTTVVSASVVPRFRRLARCCRAERTRFALQIERPKAPSPDKVARWRAPVLGVCTAQRGVGRPLGYTLFANIRG